jgi:hypothetical protein
MTESVPSTFVSKFARASSRPGVAQDHVEATEMSMGLIDGLENRDIERQCQHGIALGGNETVQRLRIARGRGHLIAALKGGFRPAMADSA